MPRRRRNRIDRVTSGSAQRARRPLRQRRDGRPLVARPPRSCSSGGCGSPCCGPSASWASTSRPRPSRPTRRWSTWSTSTRSRPASESPATTSRPASRSSRRWPATSTIHKGMTSRDLTENVEQLQIRSSLQLVRDRMVTALARLAELAAEHAELVITGRSHNVAAQATTLGKRFANAGEELLVAYRRVDELIERYPLRGIKGPVGTQQDQLDLLDGDLERLDELERGGGPPPRASTTCSPTSARCTRARSTSTWWRRWCRRPPARRAWPLTIRLMAGQELATEGFAPGQVGSSAMPHKMNTRSCERINGLEVVLRGYLTMVAGPGRRPVERGRRELLGRAPGGAARRLLRHRRPVRDVPVGAGRVRRLPGGDRAASSTGTCPSWPRPRS